MRLAVLVLAVLGAAPAGAEGWILQEEGRLATACAVGGSGGAVTDFCLSLGCPGGGDLRAVVSVTAGTPGVAVRAEVAVDGGTATALDLRRAEGGVTWEGPVAPEFGLVEALTRGRRAQVSLGWKAGGIEGGLGLEGSAAAIGAVREACTAPDAAAAVVVSAAASLLLGTAPRASEDPAGAAIAENAGFCVPGTPGVEPGFATLRDLDGDGVNDLVLDYAGLTCDGARAFCGSGGCSTEVWMGDRTGPWRLVIEGLIEGVETPSPGALRVRLDGGACGRAGAEACEARFRFEDGAPVPE